MNVLGRWWTIISPVIIQSFKYTVVYLKLCSVWKRSYGLNMEMLLWRIVELSENNCRYGRLTFILLVCVKLYILDSLTYSFVPTYCTIFVTKIHRWGVMRLSIVNFVNHSVVLRNLLINVCWIGAQCSHVQQQWTSNGWNNDLTYNFIFVEISKKYRKVNLLSS